MTAEAISGDRVQCFAVGLHQSPASPGFHYDFHGYNQKCRHFSAFRQFRPEGEPRMELYVSLGPIVRLDAASRTEIAQEIVWTR